MKKYIITFATLFVVSSCCKKDVYIEPDIVDEVIGIYEGTLYDQFGTLKNYKVKVIKLSSISVKITPYIGNEFETFSVMVKKSDNELILEDYGHPGKFLIYNSIVSLEFRDKVFEDRYSGQMNK